MTISACIIMDIDLIPTFVHVYVPIWNDKELVMKLVWQVNLLENKFPGKLLVYLI